jgi:hypothetical protein
MSRNKTESKRDYFGATEDEILKVYWCDFEEKSDYIKSYTALAQIPDTKVDAQPCKNYITLCNTTYNKTNGLVWTGELYK